MKEKPILFSGEMVRAILDGRKTQTRRVVKERHQPNGLWGRNPATGQEQIQQNYPLQNVRPWWNIGGINGAAIHCPYGQVGDRLWVKETFSLLPSGQIWYRADGHSINDGHWKPSIFMRRKYSRITLEIVSARVERLNEISFHDARCEGIWGDGKGGFVVAGTEICERDAVVAYRRLWESINGAGSWADNPWVWVIEFTKLSEAGHRQDHAGGKS